MTITDHDGPDPDRYDVRLRAAGRGVDPAHHYRARDLAIQALDLARQQGSAVPQVALLTPDVMADDTGRLDDVCGHLEDAQGLYQQAGRPPGQ